MERPIEDPTILSSFLFKGCTAGHRRQTRPDAIDVGAACSCNTAAVPKPSSIALISASWASRRRLTIEIRMIKAGGISIIGLGLVADCSQPMRRCFSSTAIRRETTPATEQALLNRYCITCHNQRQNWGLALDTIDLERVGEHPMIWERVVRKIRTGMMPPGGAPRPERPVLDAFVSELETRLDRATRSTPIRERPYCHASTVPSMATRFATCSIWTLMSCSCREMNPATVSTILPMHWEFLLPVTGICVLRNEDQPSRYRQSNDGASLATYRAPAGLTQDRHIDGLPLGTRGGMIVQHTFPLDAEYEFGVTGSVFTMDGQPVEVNNLRNFRLPVKAGPHT